jgi:hypothetical protein
LHGLSSNKATGVVVDKISSKIIKIAAPAIFQIHSHTFSIKLLPYPLSLTNGKRQDESYLSIKMANETCQEITDQFQFCLSLAKLWSEFCTISYTII